ncbi:YihY/virulence factor BrkB family protein [Glaciihabitans sp. dw_435]|uniref:YihY/virulence factor BrkB family protein n=1 Tax=Glaciihabitans sp. dw_435 TaxID=2720081 RepID=UPI001BD2AAF0|nr:YihY/virulence factor BrkB family protein [Glaciihabitans sp. dw_435]
MSPAPLARVTARVSAIVARVVKLKPVRVFTEYGSRRGPILASGLAYQAIFAVFAAIWVVFSVIGLFLEANKPLQDSLFALISTSVPGLLDTGDGTGAIDTKTLLETGVLSWTGAIALGGLFFTALGWLASGRDSVRTMFGLGAPKTNFILLKLKDLGLGLGFGVALLVSAAMSVLSTSALDVVFGWVSIDPDNSIAGIVIVRIVGLLIVLGLDTIVLAAFFRFVAGIQIPFRRLAGGALLGGIGLGVLKALGSVLLGGATNNPLLASFAVIIGLLIWFNLTCQVILISAEWIAVGMTDAGIPFDRKAEAARLAEVERLAAEAALESQRKADEDAAARPRGLARLFRRKKRAEKQ